ncbi:MAG: prepilin-type N-terminal cleavage/methylation domain-containing protein [Planctomycetes bacterium]|nr:prepilin-type N-terminal cleavage/methylation domain-containing protein [Planctomycetota bacterium]
MKRSARRGFTLLEVVLASVLLTAVLGAALMVVTRGKSAMAEGHLHARAEARAHRALQRVIAELRGAGIDALVPALNPNGLTSSSTLTFDPLQGVSGGALVWGSPVRIARVSAPEDGDDGRDNDGDGVVDEGVLMLTRDPGGASEASFLICSQVRELAEGELPNGGDDNGNGLPDEAGFSIQRIGSMLTVRITVEEAGEGGETGLATVTSSVTLRN